jgi:choline dehydrogenase-like flavoprotein
MIDLAEIAKSSSQGRHYISHLRNLVFDAPRLSSFTLNWIIQRYLRYRRIPYVALESRDGRYPIDFNGEQIPNPDSRVYLGREQDRFGMRRLIVDWKMTDQDVTSIIKTFHIWQSILEESGIGALVFDSEKFPDLVKASVPVGGHHIGTTRMSADPTEGVVDENCKVHGMDNLFIAGGSVFPTTGHANPTLTVVALAMRLGTHLRSLILTRGREL